MYYLLCALVLNMIEYFQFQTALWLLALEQDSDFCMSARHRLNYDKWTCQCKQVQILLLWAARTMSLFWLKGKGRLVALCSQAALGQFKKLWRGKSEELKLWVTVNFATLAKIAPSTLCELDIQGDYTSAAAQICPCWSHVLRAGIQVG